MEDQAIKYNLEICVNAFSYLLLVHLIKDTKIVLQKSLLASTNIILS